jgi:hypothetical protein
MLIGISARMSVVTTWFYAHSYLIQDVKYILCVQKFAEAFAAGTNETTSKEIKSEASLKLLSMVTKILLACMQFSLMTMILIRSYLLKYLEMIMREELEKKTKVEIINLILEIRPKFSLGKLWKAKKDVLIKYYIKQIKKSGK